MASLRVFVSHATNDATFANNFSQDLRQLGADVWLDSSHLGVGDFVARINDALQRSDVFVLVLTPAALASRWVQQEMNAAITREKQGILRALFVVEAQHCPLGAIPPLWTVYNRYDANSDYTAALYGVAEKMGLQVPRASAQSAPVSPTPNPPAQEAATPIPPSPTPLPPAPVSTSTTPAPWSPYPMPISLPHTPVPEAPGRPASTLTSKGKRPAHRWIFGSAVVATLSGLITVVYESGHSNLYGPMAPSSGFTVAIILPGLVATLFAWISSFVLTTRERAFKWTIALAASILFAIVSTIGFNGEYSHGDLIVVAICSLAAFILPLRIGYKGLGKSSRSVGSPPPPYAAAAPSAPAATPAPSWRRSSRLRVIGATALFILVTVVYVLTARASGSIPGFVHFVCVLYWIATLSLTLRRRAWGWTAAAGISIAGTIIVGLGA